MTPIRFSCGVVLPLSPQEVASQILDLGRWPEFEGYGPLPGIEKAEFESRTPEIVGTRIAVTNRDGSTHTEEILEWEPLSRLKLRLHEFSPPVSRLALMFEESWDFNVNPEGTHVVRSFDLHPRNLAVKPLLWLISLMLKRAITRHLRQMQHEAV